MVISKNILLASVFLSSLGLLSSCQPRSQPEAARPPVTLLPAGGQEPTPNNLTALAGTDFQPIIALGQRNLEWLNLVNKNRTLETRLNLADRTTKNPVPPESPRTTSVASLKAKYSEIIASLPIVMRPYLLENKELVEIPPMTDIEFLTNVRLVNKVYQATIRWIGSQKYLDYYSHADVKDIRGYYFFMKDPTAVEKLGRFDSLEPAERDKYLTWLASMCHNSFKSKEDCAKEAQAAALSNQVLNLYRKYLSTAQSTYNDYFRAEKMRPDLTWDKSGAVLTQNFVMPSLSNIATWFKTNVEEEWKAVGFQLLINFVPKNDVAPYLEFVKGVTPHVSGLTWNIITMDPDYSLDDYSTQWTIRHEFGHVLGFPDCYLEFYDESKSEMVYYTIEPDNLMCAWGGLLQPSHVAELKRVYQ